MKTKVITVFRGEPLTVPVGIPHVAVTTGLRTLHLKEMDYPILTLPGMCEVVIADTQLIALVEMGIKLAFERGLPARFIRWMWNRRERRAAR